MSSNAELLDALLQETADRINGRHSFVSERVLQLIVSGSEKYGSVTFEKADLCRRIGCYIRTLDRALVLLRREGLIVSEAVFNENGAQLGNSYKATPKGISLVEGFSEKRYPGERGGINARKDML